MNISESGVGYDRSETSVELDAADTKPYVSKVTSRKATGSDEIKPSAVIFKCAPDMHLAKFFFLSQVYPAMTLANK